MARAYQTRPCRVCGGPKADKATGYRHNWYCHPCSEQKRQEYRASHPWYCGECTQHWSCAICTKNKKKRQIEAAQRGAATRRVSQAGYFRPFNAERFWQQRSHASVTSAIKRGLLPSLKSGEYACVDCAGIALEYDHRDYSRPLDVVPVCRSCNKRRGTAIWPSADHFQFAKYAEKSK